MFEAEIKLLPEGWGSNIYIENESFGSVSMQLSSGVIRIYENRVIVSEVPAFFLLLHGESFCYIKVSGDKGSETRRSQ